MGPESTSQLFPTPERRPPSRALDDDPVASRLRRHNSRGRLNDPLSEVEADVVAALGLGRFHLLYQPRVAVSSTEVVAVEALLRWRDATRGLLNPGAFLPTVSQTSAMAALGRWILDEATAEAGHWEHYRPAGSRPVMMSVNVEGREVLEPGFEDTVLATLDERELPAPMLQLEVDASDPLRSETLVAKRLQALRHRGVRIAIDGATPQIGAGSVRIDADAVHVQRRWVRGIGGDTALAGAVAELIERVHRSGGTVCALGVETKREAETLAVMGCDHAQGFLYSDPVEASHLGWLAP